MDTGKVEYAPDYKSDKKPLPTIAEMSGSINFGGRVIFEGNEQVVISVEEAQARDYQKLKDAVVEAAKAHRQSRAHGHTSNVESSDCRGMPRREDVQRLS